MFVSYTDTSGIRIRNNSTDNLVTNCSISFTGRTESNNGEAVYIGASSQFWAARGPDRSSRNSVAYNYIGPYVLSESVDIKEGVDNVIVEHKYMNIKHNNYVI